MNSPLTVSLPNCSLTDLTGAPAWRSTKCAVHQNPQFTVKVATSLAACSNTPGAVGTEFGPAHPKPGPRHRHGPQAGYPRAPVASVRHRSSPANDGRSEWLRPLLRIRRARARSKGPALKSAGNTPSRSCRRRCHSRAPAPRRAAQRRQTAATRRRLLPPARDSTEGFGWLAMRQIQPALASNQEFCSKGSGGMCS